MLDNTKGVIRIRISREDKKCLMILKGVTRIRISREDKNCLMILKW